MSRLCLTSLKSQFKVFEKLIKSLTNNGQFPLEKVLSAIMIIVSITGANNRRANARGHRDANGDVGQLEMVLLQLVLDRDVARAVAGLVWPACDGW